LPLAATEKPDLVLMDIQLPGINGIEALKKLRAAPETSRIPVLAFTASVMPQDRKEIMSAGFDGFVSKPINLKEFIASIANTLGKPGGTA
jgi:two-component system cell cycle response regulator DivK